MGQTMPFLIAVFAGLALTPAAAWLGRRIGFLDTPMRTDAVAPGGPLKIHRDPVPLLGGAAVIGAALFALALDGGGLGAATVAGILLALAVGIVDDVRSLGTGPRVAMQLAAGACLVPDVLERSGGGAIVAVVVIALVFVCANAVNLVDGQDGLTGGLAAIASLGLVVLGETSGSVAATAPGLALGGALVAFLIWNRPPARIFLGDGGAYAVGTMLVAVAAAAAADGEVEVLVGAAACLALFVFEFAFTIVRRIRAGRLTRGDRLHSYDLVSARLGNRTAATMRFWAVGLLLAAAGAAVTALGPAAAAIAAAVAVAAGVVAAQRLWGGRVRPTDARGASPAWQASDPAASRSRAAPSAAAGPSGSRASSLPSSVARRSP